MQWLSQIVFLIVVGIPVYCLIQRIKQIRSNILKGQDIERSDDSGERWKQMLFIALGQKKMFHKPIPALLHLLVYVGFLVINIEVMEFLVDGLLGTHRFFASYLGSFYTFVMNFFELLALGVLVSCIIFLFRRNILKVKRFDKPEMQGWPAMDANLILIIECVLMIAILKMNAADQVLQSRGVEGYPHTGYMMISGVLIPLLGILPDTMLVLVERSSWWFHTVGIFTFAVYVTYSKHLHILLAFPNTYYSNLQPKGKIQTMKTVTQEVKLMLGMPVADSDTPEEVVCFGAKDATDLSWKSLLEAYTCTECGRCTDECPANQTGKLLSPRKVMMDTRARIEEIGKGEGADKSLLGSYISKEEINACTSCNACTEACPVNIDPLAILLEMKRYVAMEEAGTPASWNAMFSNIETNFAPWKFAPSARFNWSQDLNKD